MINKPIKGYMENTKVVLTNEKLKGFKYPEELETKEFNMEFEELAKIDLTHFKSIIDFLRKSNYERFCLEIKEGRLLIYKDCENSFKFEINLINKEITNKSKSVYSVEYVYTFLKNFKKSDIKNSLVNLYFNDDYPLYIKTELNKSCLIAPIVE